MAYPSRDSSLRTQNSRMYHVMGTPREENRMDSNTISSQLAQTSFDEEVADAEYNVEDEETGFSTPDSNSEKPLSYSYPSPADRHHHIPPNQLRNYIKHDRQWGGVSSTGEPDDDFIPKALTKLVGSRAFKRYLSLYIVIMVTFWIWWFRYYTPKQTKAAASSFLMNSLKGRFEDDSEWGYFGTNKRVEFANMQHLRTLDRSLVPGSDILGAQNRRLIVIGDINGCADELETLLKEASFDPSSDHLISTGDMISKGPSSSKVIDIMMNYNASCVRGNHEDRVLHAYRDHHAPTHQKIFVGQERLIEPSGIPLKRGHHKDLVLAASLSPNQISYISSCPIILNLGSIPSMGVNVSVVHAGLIPGVSLERQDPTVAMTIRSIDLRNQVPSPHHAPNPMTGPPPRPRNRLRKPDYSEWDEQGRLAVLPWGEVWDAFQDLIPTLMDKEEEEEVSHKNGSSTQGKKAKRYQNLVQTSLIHGHGSRRGIAEKEGKWHFGLEGGCHRGGKLTAMILEESRSRMLGFAGGRDVKRRFTSIPCKGTGQGRT